MCSWVVLNNSASTRHFVVEKQRVQQDILAKIEELNKIKDSLF